MESTEKIREKLTKKNLRKQNRCKNILRNHEGLKTVDVPTKFLFVGNGGLVCGIQREILMEVFNPYGSVQDIVMIPDKPYAFVVYADKKQSEIAMEHLHGQKLSPKFDSSLYMCYVNDLPQKMQTKNVSPPGLIIIEDFISEAEEQMWLDLINFDSEDSAMKHRRVKHFGYEFNYSTNNVDKDKPLENKIPEICYQHLERLMVLGHITNIPDQLTVNHYLPGQGIPPHIDTHSAFDGEIISISLGSQVIMDFSQPSKEHIPVLLPRRSAIIMTGESRYLWKHGIPLRKTDVISVYSGDNCHLTLSYRQTRTSFTFRHVRHTPCNCTFIDQCDSQMPKLQFGNEICETAARNIENKHVTEVYEKIADHFSETRYKPWPSVAKFLNSLPLGTILVDAGCGNGKNMGGNTRCFTVGSDISMNLAKVCSGRKLQVVVGDMLHLPFRDDCADACICIAVIHHMATEKRRLNAIKEIIRVLRSGGQSLIYVWAFEQEMSGSSSNYLDCEKIARNSLKDPEAKEGSALSEILPVHDNRTHFEQQDILVPWHKKTSHLGQTQKDVYQRFYHVFKKGELEALISQTDAQIRSSYYDNGNWCVIIEKC